MVISERLRPRAEIDIERPGASWLRQHINVRLSNRIRVRCAIRVVGTIRTAGGTHGAIDVEMGHMPFGPSSLAALWARLRNANLPMAKGADRANPFTPAVAPVNRIAPCPRGSIRFAACCATRKAPKALIAMHLSTAAGSRSVSSPDTRELAL
jgi:hypothetical protein